MIHKKVRFKGEIYWLHDGYRCTNLSPLNHYTNDGEITVDTRSDISYAVIEGTLIVRFGEPIGTVDDLEDV